MAKTTDRIRVKSPKQILPTLILIKRPQHIQVVYAACRLRSNDIELFVPLTSQ
ncbi:unnamed protein product [Blumeria hordei]|uniref:Uncharacterized protein n=1 Tax=Blumeria hordei TaxID=2867405 RepID=A0A383USU5_BLUHO|nr:unnamed protein product [Blumeria hordei]